MPARRDDLEISARDEGDAEGDAKGDAKGGAKGESGGPQDPHAPAAQEPPSSGRLPNSPSPPDSLSDWVLSSSVGSLFGAQARPAPSHAPQAKAGAPQPARVASYLVEGELGRGAMGVVLLARDPASGRRVALKLIQGEVDERRLERFRREGELTARLRHPGIVGVHAAGTWEGKPYLAYELVEGARTLDEVFKERELPERVELVRAAAEALGAAHDLGIIHRDVKPENVLVDAHGRVRVADFGLATAQDLDTLTRTGATVGTPVYMAPEKFMSGSPRGANLDVWSLGVVLYEAICDELPFMAKSVPELIKNLSAPARRPRALRPDVPADLEAICLRALSHDLDLRYPDASALAADLERFLAGEPVEASGPGLPWLELGIFAGLACAFLLLALIYRAWPSSPAAQPPTPTPQATLSPAQPSFRLTLQEPVRDAFSATDRVRVAGQVSSSAAWVEVQVDENVRRLAPGERFAMRAILDAPGKNTIQVQVRDAAGASETRQVVVWRVPEWFAELSASARPPLPLPSGLHMDPQNPRIYLNRQDRQQLVYVPPMRDSESFRLGTPVRITKGFFLGRYEVTWSQYLSFVEATRHVPPRRPKFAKSDSYPVVRVSWEDAALYASWAGLRLPTEAEWVYAALGTDGRIYPWGNSLQDTGGRTNVKDGDKHTDRYPFASPVDAFPGGASPFGCQGMSGNVFEWVNDYYAPLPRGSELRLDPRGPSQGTERVTRGGGFDHEIGFARITDAQRYKDRAMRALLHTGFRVARDAEE